MKVIELINKIAISFYYNFLFFLDCFYKKIFWKIFSYNNYKIAHNLKKLNISPKYLIDVGGNNGQFSYIFHKVFKLKELIIFEPNPSLIKNINKNLKNVKKLLVFNKALSIKKGTLNFNFYKDSQLNSLHSSSKFRNSLFPEKTSLLKKTYIDVDVLDNFITPDTKYKLKNTLLKIDVQGHEINILKGFKKHLKLCRWILLEVSFDELYQEQSDVNELIKFLSKNNFAFNRIINYHFRPNSNVIMESDLLFTNKSYQNS